MKTTDCDTSSADTTAGDAVTDVPGTRSVAWAVPPETANARGSESRYAPPTGASPSPAETRRSIVSDTTSVGPDAAAGCDADAAAGTAPKRIALAATIAVSARRETAVAEERMRSLFLPKSPPAAENTGGSHRP
ncbi:hypothetical protein CXR34_16185 [Microbacterium hominis]|uniref:Uncharacterized protein n=1 Tax=Microbacterium hominis TaxID=162426 RepID=A0A2K9DMP9_9MICO|nr:hypothetical protein CXR34_16185 [Microbacterium hominis]